MGFLDKAKKLAEQAQTKLDDVQQQINRQPGSGTTSGGPITEYDKHGRPIPPAQSSAPPQGDPLAGAASVPPPPAPPQGDPLAGAASAPAPPQGDPLAGAASAPAPAGDPLATPGVPPTEPAAGPPAPVESPAAGPAGPAVPGVPETPAAPGAPAPVGEDRNHPSYAPPKLTSGDPLAG
jgi:formin 2/WAS/WASL-interacting protein